MVLQVRFYEILGCELYGMVVVIYTGNLLALKRFKDDAKEVAKGYDCGMQIKGFNDIKIEDIIEAYHEVEVKKKLK